MEIDYNSLATTIDRKGMCRLGKLFMADAVEEMLAWIDELDVAPLQVPANFEPEVEECSIDGRIRLRKVRRLIWNDPIFWSNLLREGRVFDIASSLVGPCATLIFHAAFLKARKIGSATALHQDQVLWSHAYPGAVTLWVALSPARLENGCLLGCRNSHLLGPVPHKMRPCYPWHPSLEGNEMGIASPEPIELKPGEAVIWHRYYVHGSGPNPSDVDRRGMVLVFADGNESGFLAKDRYALESS